MMNSWIKPPERCIGDPVNMLTCATFCRRESQAMRNDPLIRFHLVSNSYIEWAFTNKADRDATYDWLLRELVFNKP